MDQPRRELMRPEPIDERGNLHEAAKSPRHHPPPIRLDSLTFPTDRLPQLDVEIVSKLPGVGEPPQSRHPESTDNLNTDPLLPLPIEPEKYMFNLWEKTNTQTELRWSKPENAANFSSIAYELQIKDEEGVWQQLVENRQPLYRVYFAEGTAIFGRRKISQESSTTLVRLRLRPIGIIASGGREDRRLGPWTEDILFSLEGTRQK